MSKPTLIYDPGAKVYRDADGQVGLGLPGAELSESMTPAQHAIAVAFGYSAGAARDILLVGSGDTPDEESLSQAHFDTVAAFAVETESRV